ncbi:PaaI family thioesterase [Desulfosediminicola flagellatus]|uniref:PaaI family thioesterase n=1 Tax=Desulfosediminicola flagellatus TaxID=2569541 RepID=UPI0010AB869A|nr:PaaI family thioesterase [Desulfosediminicola flagellatus]
MFEGLPENAKRSVQWQSLVGVDKECFGCGEENSHGLQMKFEMNDSATQLRSHLIMDKRFRGWSNLIHGGVLSTILDETMGWTVLCLTKQFMLTKGMQVAFKKPVRIGMKITSTGYIKEHLSKKKIVVVAEIRDDAGALCASSEGEFALFSKEQFLRMGIMPEEDINLMVASIA